MDNISKIATNVIVGVNKALEEDKKRQQELMLQQMRQQLFQVIKNNAIGIACELSQVFQDRQYSRISPVNTVYNIRIDRVKRFKQGIIYFYRIDKSTTQYLSKDECNQIRRNMNFDVVQFGDMLSYEFYPYEIECMYPHLYYGLRIINVANQLTYVELAVATITIW